MGLCDFKKNAKAIKKEKRMGLILRIILFYKNTHERKDLPNPCLSQKRVSVST
jgi:hypothetical protein